MNVNGGKRVQIDERTIEGHLVTIYELYVTRQQELDEDPLKFVVRVVDQSDIRHDQEFMFDHIFPARAQRRRCVDYVRGLIKRKIRQKMGKRRYRMKELSHRKGAQTAQEYKQTRAQAVEELLRRRMNGHYSE